MTKRHRARFGVWTSILVVVASADCSARNVQPPCDAAAIAKAKGYEPCWMKGGCQVLGWCWQVPNDNTGKCFPICESECQLSDNCTQSQFCALIGDSCATDSRFGCANTFWCHESGACTQSGPTCVVGDETSCVNSHYCQLYGSCHFIASLGKCRPLSEAECQASTDFCAKQGRCHYFNSGHYCIALSDADCQASNYCKTMGYCKFDEETHFCARP